MAVTQAPRSLSLPVATPTTTRVAGLGVLLAATLVAPVLMLIWMPILLGVPHVASDLRYLLLPLPRWQAALSALACTALVIVKAVAIAAGAKLVTAEVAIVAGWLVAMVSLAPTTPVRYLLVGAVAVAIVVVPVQFVVGASLAHNFVAVAAWLVIAKPSQRTATILLGVLVAAVAVSILLGPAAAAATGGDASRWLTIDRAATTLFGGVPIAIARPLVIAFTFLQGVHYAIWLGWLPRDVPRRRTSFGTAAVAGMTAIVVAGALIGGPPWARTTYLALATFHIYLELVVLGARLARRPR